MSFIRNFFLYSTAIVIALAAVPSAVVGWSELSPHSFSTAVHAAVDLFDDGHQTGAEAPKAMAQAPEAEADEKPATVLGQQLASVQ